VKNEEEQDEGTIIKKEEEKERLARFVCCSGPQNTTLF